MGWPFPYLLKKRWKNADCHLPVHFSKKVRMEVTSPLSLSLFSTLEIFLFSIRFGRELAKEREGWPSPFSLCFFKEMGKMTTSILFSSWGDGETATPPSQLKEKTEILFHEEMERERERDGWPLSLLLFFLKEMGRWPSLHPWKKSMKTHDSKG